MSPWNTYDHDDAYNDLRVLANRASSLGAKIGSCGPRKLTIKWPDGGIVHIRRFLNSRFRWLVFGHADYHAVFVTDRDLSLSDLKRAAADKTASNHVGQIQEESR